MDWTEAADEFGRHVRAGGWRLGLLVACTVGSGAVELDDFAERAKVSRNRVRHYLRGWEAAAEANVVPAAATMTVADVERELDEETLGSWSSWYKPVIGGRDSSPAVAATIIANSGAEAVIGALPIEQRQAVATAILNDPAVTPTAVAHPVIRQEVDRAVTRSRAAADASDAQYEGTMTRIGRAKSLRLLDSAIATLRNLVDSLRANGLREQDRQQFAALVGDVRRLVDLAEVEAGGGGVFSDDDRQFLAELEGRTA